MRELSMHILDIAQNSIAAGAKLVRIDVVEDATADTMMISVADDGSGMDPGAARQIRDPFVTSRTTRQVGLGIPLFAAAAERCGGNLDIESALGAGTTVRAIFGLSHIDRAPLGDMAGTLMALSVCNPDVDFVYNRKRGDSSFHFDTREIRAELDGVPLSDPEVAAFIRNYVEQGERGLGGTS